MKNEYEHAEQLEQTDKISINMILSRRIWYMMQIWAKKIERPKSLETFKSVKKIANYSKCGFSNSYHHEDSGQNMEKARTRWPKNLKRSELIN